MNLPTSSVRGGRSSGVENTSKMSNRGEHCRHHGEQLQRLRQMDGSSHPAHRNIDNSIFIHDELHYSLFIGIPLLFSYVWRDF
jgi:hypothetical protein